MINKFDLDLANYAKDVCFITEEKNYTYCEVDEICTALKDQFPKEKKLIFVKAKTNVETLIAYITCLQSNMAFLMIDANLDEALFSSMLEIYKPNYIWEEKIESKEYIASYSSYGLYEYSVDEVELNPELSLMLSTSGTTGSPKLVKLTKENIYANCKSIVEYLQIKPDDIAITNLPLHYSYGLSIINTHLASGASIVVNDDSIVTKEFWEVMKKYKVTTLNGVPYNYEIFRRVGLMTMDLPDLKVLTQAGGKLNEKFVLEFATWAKETNREFFVMYGQTEATARISYLPPKTLLDNISSMGISIPDGELKIKDLNSEQYIDEVNKEGELVYFGKNVMLGYATTQSDLAKQNELNYELHTGDIAKKDEKGYFYITGRLKRFIKMHGNRVGLDEVEHFLKREHFDILVTGVENKLLIATTMEDEIKNIKRVVVDKYGFHNTTVKVKYFENYPVTSSGKIKYQDIIKEF